MKCYFSVGEPHIAENVFMAAGFDRPTNFEVRK